MKNQSPKLIVILGFTGSGKSDLAIDIAKEYNGEIVSADSRQLYKEMNIGTGKIPGKWIDTNYYYKDIVHHFIDIYSPSQSFSVGEYKDAVDELIVDISNREKLPILVGGTAQYIYAVVDNWQIPRVEPNIAFRNEFEAKLKKGEISLESLWEELIQKDPEAAEFVQREAPRRIIRALEVIDATGEKFSVQRQKKPAQYESLILGIDVPRDSLYQRVDQRIDAMLAAGLEQEVRDLFNTYGADCPGMQTIGYKEFIPYFNNQQTAEEVVERIKFNTHRYVRYQNTWFNKDARIHWINNSESAKMLVSKFTD